MTEKIYNLAYHATAVDRPMLWFNLCRLKRQLHRFNGKKIITIVKLGNDAPTRELMHFTDQEMSYIDNMTRSTIERIIRYLDDSSIEYEIVNNSELTEAGHFFDIVAPYLFSADPNEMTFYGHTKGIRYRTEDVSFPALVMWTNTLYNEVLCKFDDAHQKILVDKTHDAYGAVKHDGKDFEWCGQSVDWHYSGTMFWFRHDAVFTHADWHDATPNRFKLEYFLPRLISSDRAYSSYYLPEDFETTAHLANTFSWVHYMTRMGRQSNMDVLVNFVRNHMSDTTVSLPTPSEILP